jgi:hypothetical protein
MRSIKPTPRPNSDQHRRRGRAQPADRAPSLWEVQAACGATHTAPIMGRMCTWGTTQAQRGRRVSKSGSKKTDCWTTWRRVPLEARGRLPLRRADAIYTARAHGSQRLARNYDSKPQTPSPRNTATTTKPKPRLWQFSAANTLLRTRNPHHAGRRRWMTLPPSLMPPAAPCKIV